MGAGSQVAVLASHTPAGARPEELSFGQMLKRAEVLAKTQLVPKPLQGAPEAIVLVGALGAELGIPFITSLSEIHVIEGRPSPSAQMRLALVRRAGHEVEFTESSEEQAAIRGRRRERRDDPDGWVTVTWTMEQARRAGLTDRWVERWTKSSEGRNVKQVVVVGDRDGIFTAEERARRGLPEAIPEWAQKALAAGEVKQKDNWVKYPADMLRARAASALCRMAFSDVLTGLGVHQHTTEELGVDIAQDVDEPLPDSQDEDIVDGEIVEQGEDIVLKTSEGAVSGDSRAPSSAPSGQTAPADRDNAVEPETVVVGSAAVPGPTTPGDWPALAKHHGVTIAGLLRKAREFAGARALPLPASIEEVTDEQVVADVMDWLGE
jgi:hypothetical protein